MKPRHSPHHSHLGADSGRPLTGLGAQWPTSASPPVPTQGPSVSLTQSKSPSWATLGAPSPRGSHQPAPPCAGAAKGARTVGRTRTCQELSRTANSTCHPWVGRGRGWGGAAGCDQLRPARGHVPSWPAHRDAGSLKLVVTGAFTPQTLAHSAGQRQSPAPTSQGCPLPDTAAPLHV